MDIAASRPLPDMSLYARQEMAARRAGRTEALREQLHQLRTRLNSEESASRKQIDCRTDAGIVQWAGVGVLVRQTLASKTVGKPLMSLCGRVLAKQIRLVRVPQTPKTFARSAILFFDSLRTAGRRFRGR